jgi:SpoVK/Ycf46/Vps4 family AAA+-type ATPase
MVTLPLLCPQLFQDLGLSPPRGVLFTGPPGTGKTLTARALAATCSQLTGEPVAFFVRKGADCLSKWVGEAEKQLRLLFEEARARQPAIIFFDEIDGLAPVRSSQHDQSHTSVVATLLALMDGLESRGRVIVVGATNRVDAIDPALRRPGRFDRELLFSLPSLPARKDILAIHTRKWHPRPAPALIDSLAARTTGYCGADLKALCTEASLAAIRRAVPALYNPSLASMRSAAALPAVSAAQVAVLDPDFDVALAKIVPASRRVAPTPSVPLSPALHPLLHKRLTRALAGLRSVWPDSLVSQSSQTAAGSLPHASAVGVAATANLVRPRILIHGPRATGQRQVAAALLHEVDEFPCYDLSLPALVATGAPPEEAFLRLVREAQRAAPAVLFWPDVGQWWASASPVLRSVAAAALSQLPTGVAVLVVATAEQDLTDPADGQETPPELAWWAEVRPLFDSYAHMSEHVDLGTLNNKQVQGWAGQLLEKTVVAVLDGVAAAKTAKEAASTAIAAPTNPDTPTAASSSAPSSAPSASRALTVPLQSAEKLREQQRSDEVLILHLRMFLRSVAAHLAANFRDFTAPEVMALHTDRVPGMFFLRDAQLKVADSRYLSVREFLVDIDRSATAVKAHFTADTALGRTLLQRVGHMQDTALALCMGLDRDVLTACEVMAMRLRSQPGGFVPWPSLIFVPEDLPDASGSGAASDKPADTNANAPVDANAVKSSTASTAGAPPQLGTKAQALSSLFGKPSAPKPSAPATATPAVPAATQPKPAPARPSPRKSSAWEATKPLTTQLSRVHDVEQLETLWGRAQLCVPAAVKTVVERAKNVTELDAAIAAVVELVAAIPLKVKKSNKQV